MLHFLLPALIFLGRSALSVESADSTLSLTGISKRPSRVLNSSTPAAQRCEGTLGTWCKGFHDQKAVPWKPPVRGSKSCPDNCNSVGNCNAATGYCECPAGWTGPGCTIPQKRPCTNEFSTCDNFVKGSPKNHSDADGKDLNWKHQGSSHSRCGGICDDDLGMCWCGGPQGRIPAPKGSPPGTPPIRQGRPMTTTELAPMTAKDGSRNGWGERPYEEMYGEKGWCVAAKPGRSLPCIVDGLLGELCDEVIEPFCINQCSGRGLCNLGFCKCDPGWYGQDCSLKIAGQPIEESRIAKQSWLKNVAIQPPASLDPPPKPERKRPLIYVYDLEPLFSSKMLQYRIARTWCIHRQYHSRNVSTDVSNWVYSVDTMLHESMLQSEHRTYDPEEADFFYVPQYSVCYIYPIQRWADFPWFGAPTDPRVSGAAMMLVEIHKWLVEKFPYWNRRGGRDHIFLFTHDEGACWVPNVLTNATWLTHWGKLDKDHKSETAFMADNYNMDYPESCKKEVVPGGWLQHIQGHVCYDPVKDLIVPAHKPFEQYDSSPLMGAAPLKRDKLFFFRGDVGKHRWKHYSRGVRQAIYKMAKEQNWAGTQASLVGDTMEISGDYSRMLSTSTFCLVTGGDGFSARMEDSTLNGCIPVVIMDNVHGVFESILDYSQFAVRLDAKEVPNLMTILKAIPESRVREMQQALSTVWHRFRWSSAAQQVFQTTERFQQNTRVRLAARQALAAAEGTGRGHSQRHLTELDSTSTNTIQSRQGGEGESSERQRGSAKIGKTEVTERAGEEWEEEWEESEGGRARSLSSLFQQKRSASSPRLPRPFRGEVDVDDAFNTIIQWLHSRIPFTR